MTNRSKDFECELDLSDKAYSHAFHGVTHAYAINRHGREHLLCKYNLLPIVAIGSKNDPRETRAYRELSRNQGKHVPKIHQDALRDELFIVPGAAMSAADVVEVLRAFIEQVEKHGMFIGKYKDAYIKESVAVNPSYNAG